MIVSIPLRLWTFALARTPSKTFPLSDRVFSSLRNDIEAGRFGPGDKLPTEKEIAEREGVSRTVVREAVARLAAQGIAEARQGSGLYVSIFANFPAFQISPHELADVEDVLKLLELRSAVEAEMASLAALRRDEQDLADMADALSAIEAVQLPAAAAIADAAFHEAISRATKNEYYTRFLKFLGARLVPPRELLSRHSIEAGEDYAAVLSHEHRAVYDAIAAGQPTVARLKAHEHIRKSIARHHALLEQGHPADRSAAMPTPKRMNASSVPSRRD